MNTIKYKTNDFELEITLDADGLKSVRHNGNALQLAEADVELCTALISLSLQQYVNDYGHDEESGMITWQAQPTNWTNKALAFKPLLK